MKQLVKIIAHRGYSSLYPENSLEGFEQAWKLGADMIETDIREASDGSLICSHDETKKEALPFSDALAFAKGKVPLLLDLKLDAPDFHLKVEQALLRHQMQDDVVIGVRSLDQARHMRSLLPSSCLLGFLKDARDFPEFYKTGGSIARLWEGDIDERNLELAKSGDHPVFVMAGFYPKETSGIGDITPDRINKLMSLDIQGILVNDPLLALRVRSERAQKPDDAHRRSLDNKM
ncbi:MAG: glycerophosphodiester phosphodiesterase [Alphaproteobacteria bacterium]|nr:MAG: glycerophosphodiester phosphodiesterase [Alphaproteobacteria bacterium]